MKWWKRRQCNDTTFWTRLLRRGKYEEPFGEFPNKWKAFTRRGMNK